MMRGLSVVALTFFLAAPSFAADTPSDVAKSISMADIDAATYVMGLDPGNGSAFGYPKRTIKIPAFRIGTHEITFEQYDAFARATKRALPEDEGWGRGNRPVINVDWADIHAFIAWLNTSGRRFRLPSEAEWEYAASAGATTTYAYGNEMRPELGNTNANAAPDTYMFTAPVGQFPPNAFGLYDMAGNVWEWAADCRGPNYEHTPLDGTPDNGPPCDARASRGGGWNSGPRTSMRPQLRGSAGETFRSMALGFRLVESR